MFTTLGEEQSSRDPGLLPYRRRVQDTSQEVPFADQLLHYRLVPTMVRIFDFLIAAWIKSGEPMPHFYIYILLLNEIRFQARRCA